MIFFSKIIRLWIWGILSYLLVSFLVPPVLFADHSNEEVRIGVLAKRGAQKAMEKWGPTAQYLTKEILSHHFTIVPLDFEAVQTSVVKAEIDFLVTNSAYYVLEENHGLSRIATLRNRWHHEGYQMFAGVIFTRSDNNTINNFSDLKDKSFMAVDKNSFGGWLMARFEFHKSGIDPDKSFKRLVFGTTHDKVVFAVRDKIADAGTVRTDTLERMAAEGKIDLNNFKIIQPKSKNKSFPFVRSTDLYPEWPFAKLSHTSDKLAEQVTIALLNMPAKSPAAAAAKITGWTIPLDYGPVHHLLKELRIGRYKDLGKIAFMDMVRRYWGWIMAAVLLLVFMAGLSFYVSILNKKLKTAHSKVEKAHDTLEIKVENRTKELLESERKYRELADALPQVVFEIDTTGNIVYVNQNGLDFFRYTKEDLEKGINAIQILVPGDHDRLIKNIERVLNGKKLGGVEYTALRSDNTTFPVVIHSNLVTHNDKPVGLRGLLIDISERKKLEADLKRRALAIDHSSDTIVITDTKGDITYVNPAFERITGYSRKEALGINPHILQSGTHDKLFYKELWESISSGETWSGRFINKKKDGSHYTEDATISPVFSDKGVIISYVAVKRDVTEKLKLESQLQQGQRMETIGTLAGGIAHDFNNILFPIVGHTEMLLEDIPEDSPFRSSLDGIYTGALRASELVKQILTFSRQENSELKLLKMQPIIKEALKLIRSSIPTTIKIKQDIQTDCGVIKADPTQIHQIVMNLATNAYHAMEETGGELKVSLKEIKVDVHDVITQEMIPGVYTCLSISDTGKGMDKQLTQKIFDPFFTTKETGKGTGMGLSVVHGIIKSMGGAIKVYSEPGTGTEFKIYFPVEKSFLEPQNTRGKESIQGGTEQVLLVDDEEAILTMEKRMLDRLGYNVIPCTSSIEALEAFRDKPDKFDMVITDLAMPDMPGDKLSVELVKIRPDIPILLCTGFSDTMSEEKAASLGIKGFLLKPVVMKDLGRKVREVLGGHQ